MSAHICALLGAFWVVIWALFGLLSGRFLGYYLGAFWVISGRFLALFLALFGLLFGRFLDTFPGAFSGALWALFCVQIGQVYSTPPCPSFSRALLGQPVGLNIYIACIHLLKCIYLYIATE